MRNSIPLAALAAVSLPAASAVSLNVADPVSIKAAAGAVAHNLVSWYTGNVTNTPSTVGILPQPYYWWEAGAMWGALVDYWYLTGDDQYNAITTQALESQLGPNYDFMLTAQEFDEGNDDQAFWGFAAMSAAEKGYPEPSGPFTWSQIVENLWNTQVQRWDTATCGGGLRWQIYSSNNGWNYKNTVSNGAFFQLSARLARFTGNKTYVHWAEKSFNWAKSINLLTDAYMVYDGADTTSNCTGITTVPWTYSNGIYMYGSAVMYNYTNGSALWAENTQGFLNSSAFFFSPYTNATNVMYEWACEESGNCDNDQFSFKAYLSRFMWATTQMAPFTVDAITTLLTTSASSAAVSCSGGTDGATCGQKWYVGGYDGSVGVGQALSGLEIIQGLLVKGVAPPQHGDSVSVKLAATTTMAVVPTNTAAPSIVPYTQANSGLQLTAPSMLLVSSILALLHLI